jgi:dihydrofolate reductase
MRKLIVNEWMTLDGVVQAPGTVDEDPSGGFTHGGWHQPYFDDTARKWVLGYITGAGGYLLGRRTYEIFAAHWPDAPPEEGILAEPLNSLPKHVVSSTLAGPLRWQNSALVQGDIPAAVQALKQGSGGDLHVLGSTELVPLLLAHGLVDELRLMIDPVLAGGGKRLFGADGVLRPLGLVSSQVTSTGAILATYAPVQAR